MMPLEWIAIAGIGVGTCLGWVLRSIKAALDEKHWGEQWDREIERIRAFSAVGRGTVYGTRRNT